MSADLRLALPVAAAWAAIAVLVAAPAVLGSAAVLAWVCALACGIAAVVARRPALTVLTLVFAAVALVTTAAAVQAPARRPEILVDASAHSRSVEVDLVTTQAVHPGDGMFRATLVAASVSGSRLGASIPVLVFVQPDAAASTFGIGASLHAQGTLALADPGSSTSFSLFTRSAPRATAAPPPFLEWANSLRAGFTRASARLPGDGGDLLPGLAIGDTGAVDPTLDAAMKASSLSHLTAVSGANCAVVIGLVMLLGARLRLSRPARIGLSLAVLAGFVVLVTPEPSVLRAAVMASVVLVALATGRPLRGVPVLSLAALALLVFDPWLAREYGFVLSVLATGGLLVLASPLARLLSRWLPASLAAVVAVPLAAQLACQPVLILLAPAIPTYGILANVLAEPAAPIATVLGLIACLLVPIVPPIAAAVSWAAWLPAAWIAAIARFFAGAPGATIAWPPGVIGVAALVALTLAGLLAALHAKPRVRWIAAAAVALVVVAYVGVAAGNTLRVRLTRPGDWEFAACDIGQGDAVVIRSLDRIALVDTGPDPKSLAKCLDDLGITRIDLLVLTHYDLDHVGGVQAVVGKVDRVLVGASAGAKSDRIIADLRAGGATVDPGVQGMSGMLGDLRWDVLWPKQKLAGIEPGNDASVTLSIVGAGACESGCLSGLFLGDLGERAQGLVMAANRLATVDVVKVAHHGSADQSAALYARVHATVGLISVGIDNDYGHPTPKLLAILAGVGTTATRTDREGMVLLSPVRGGSVGIWTERAPPVADGGRG